MTKDTFAQWMQKVDSEIESVCGLTSHDLEDFGYRDAYDDGVGAIATACEVLDANGYSFQTRGDNQWTES